MEKIYYTDLTTTPTKFIEEPIGTLFNDTAHVTKADIEKIQKNTPPITYYDMNFDWTLDDNVTKVSKKRSKTK